MAQKAPRDHLRNLFSEIYHTGLVSGHLVIDMIPRFIIHQLFLQKASRPTSCVAFWFVVSGQIDMSGTSVRDRSPRTCCPKASQHQTVAVKWCLCHWCFLAVRRSAMEGVRRTTSIVLYTRSAVSTAMAAAFQCSELARKKTLIIWQTTMLRIPPFPCSVTSWFLREIPGYIVYTHNVWYPVVQIVAYGTVISKRHICPL